MAGRDGRAARRVAGNYVLRSSAPPRILMLYAVSLPLMAIVTRRLCRKSRLPRPEWPAGAISLALPTLLLDSFERFLPGRLPKIDPALAGVFGGWSWSAALASSVS